MTATRAAKYLAPIDLGKTIAVTDANTGKTVTGELQSIDAIGYNIELGIIAGKDSGEYRVNYDAEVTITGQPSPHGWDQPAQPLPAPIPAAQAADHAIDFAQVQTRPRRNGKTTALKAAQAADANYCFDCKGAGSTPHGRHYDRVCNTCDGTGRIDHEHTYAMGDARCITCKQPLTDPEPRPRGYEESNYCLSCGTDIDGNQDLCTDCLDQLERSSRLPAREDQK